MKRNLILLTFCTLIYVSTYAQEQQPEKFYKHAIGFSVGSLSGWGHTYKYFSKKAGFQVNTFWYYKDVNQSNDLKILASMGGALLYSLKRVNNFNLYAQISAGYNYSKRRVYSYYHSSSISEKKNFSIGPGVGLEVRSEFMGFNAYYGIGFNKNFTAFSMFQAGCGLFIYF